MFCVIMNEDLQVIGGSNMYKGLYDSFIPNSFFDENSDYYYTKSFVADIRGIFGGKFYINTWFECTIGAVLLYKEILGRAVQISGTDRPSADYLRLSAVGVTVRFPSGFVTVENNNHLRRPIYLMQINQMGGLYQVHPTIGQYFMGESNPYFGLVPQNLLNIPDTVYFKSKTIIKTFSLILLVANILLILVTAVYIMKNRNNKFIKCFGLSVHLQLLSGFVIGSVISFNFITIPKEDSSICSLRIVLVTISLITISSACLAKAMKIKSAKKSRKISKVMF